MPSSAKDIIIAALQANDLDRISAMALADRTVLNRLVRIAYDRESLVGWRAIIAMGRAARAMAGVEHEFLRNTCRKLLWSLNDESGGIGWAAPELLGEIISADPIRFADLVPIIAGMYEMEEEVFRSGVVYAMFCIADASPELVAGYQEILMQALADKDPMVRVRSMSIIGRLWPWATDRGVWSHEYCEKVKSALEGLRDDNGEAWIYDEIDFVSYQAKEYAINLLKSIT